MPHIELIWSNQLDSLELSADSKNAIILIDVLRCSSSIAAGLANHTSNIRVVKEIPDAFELKKSHPTALLAGERASKLIPGFDLPNSPKSIAKIHSDFLILSSGNFCNVLDQLQNLPADIYSGSINNAKATAEHLHKKNYDNLIFVPIGTYRMYDEYYTSPKKTIEDLIGAYYILFEYEQLTGILCSLISEEMRLQLNAPEKLQYTLWHGEYALYLQELDSLNKTKNNAEDMEIAFIPNQFPVVAFMSNENTFTSPSL